MECMEVEKAIPLFLENKLEGKEIREFVEHMEGCKECREELSVHFLASEGIDIIEEGESFDLDKELDGRLFGALKSYETKTFWGMTLLMTEGIAILLIIIIFLYAYL